MISQSDFEKEIHNWTKNYLDVPSDHYSGNKPCPFAKKTLEMDKALVQVCDDDPMRMYGRFQEDKEHDIYILAYEPDWPGLEDRIEILNNYWKSWDIWGVVMMPGDDDPDDETLDPEAWGAVTDEAYALVMIQSLSETNRLSYLLEKAGYYDKTSQDFRDYVESRRSLQNARKEEDPR